MAAIASCEMPRDTWTVIDSTFANCSKFREIKLKEFLYSLCRGVQSVTEYSQKFKASCDELVAICRPMDGTDKSHLHLRGLGPIFTKFSQTHM